jgi:hypothetical protein
VKPDVVPPLDRKQQTKVAGRSAGARGTPWRRRYSGQATRRRSCAAGRRATSVESGALGIALNGVVTALLTPLLTSFWR